MSTKMTIEPNTKEKFFRTKDKGMRNIWVIADTHFFHSNIIKYCNRPFRDKYEMNEALIANWNKVVGKQDPVFMLGDFALSGKDNVINIGKRLNGKKTLIMGNHDSCSLNTYHEAGFEYVSKYPIIYNDFIIMSHEPLFTNTNFPFFNIYGHVHDDINFKDFTHNSFCASAERINYTPISLERIKEKINF